MKKLILTFSAIVVSIAVFGQIQAYPEGVYMGWNEILDRTPSRQLDLQVVARTDGDIKMNGGNDYKLTSENRDIKRSFLVNDVWAYSDGEMLYLNCLKFEVQRWYADLISDGKYMVFRAGISFRGDLAEKQRTKTATMGMLFGALGGGISAAQTAMMRFLYAVDKDTRKLILIDRETMADILSVEPSLLEDFRNEPDPDSEDVQIKYLKLLNEGSPAEIDLFPASGDIGAVKHPGSADFDADSGQYILKGAGTNMWGTSDEFFMTWREVTGDFTLSADIAFEGAGVNPHRKMGLIIRDGLAPDAVYADIAVHGDGLTSLQYRPREGAETLEIIGRPSGSEFPDRITLERHGDCVVMRLENTETNSEKSTATEDDTVITLRLPEACLVGLFVCSHDPEVIETGIFSNVILETPDVQSPGEPELPLLAL